MFSSPDLTIAYIRKRPASAARVLASLEPNDAAAFLREIPTRFAISALAPMNPWSASRVIQQMGVTPGAAVLQDLGFADAAKIFRLMDKADRVPFLGQLPRRLRRDLESSLAFAVGTVGAHMIAAVAILDVEDTVAEAIALLQQAQADDMDTIYLVDDKRKFAGVVAVPALLRRPINTPLHNLCNSACAQISAHARLSAIAELDAWHDYSRLPVVSRRGELLGTLARSALRDINPVQADYADREAPSVPGALTEALAHSLGGLIDLLGGGAMAGQEPDDNRGA